MAESLNEMLVVRATHAAGTTDSETYTMGRAADAIDAVVISTNADAGTVQIQNGASALSSALNSGGTDTKVVRPGAGTAWVTAQRGLTAGDVLTFVVSSATFAYESYVYLYPTPAVAE